MMKQGIRKAPFKIFMALFITFIILLTLTWYLFEHHDILFRKVHGQVVQPSFSAALLKMRNERGELLKDNVSTSKEGWTLLYLHPGICNDACQTTLNTLHQIRSKTGEYKERIQPVILTYPNLANDIGIDTMLEQRFPETQHFTINPKRFAKIVQTHIKAPYALESGTIYMIDPLGKVVLSYKPNEKPSAIYKDLRRLIKNTK